MRYCRSDVIRDIWRSKLGVGPGDIFIDIEGHVCRITDIYAGLHGLVITYNFETGWFGHGEIDDVRNLVDWNKTKLYNEKGDLLGRCKRNGLENSGTYLIYEHVFTPKRHKLKAYMVSVPCRIKHAVKYTPEEFEKSFDIVEPFVELEKETGK